MHRHTFPFGKWDGVYTTNALAPRWIQKGKKKNTDITYSRKRKLFPFLSLSLSFSLTHTSLFVTMSSKEFSDESSYDLTEESGVVKAHNNAKEILAYYRDGDAQTEKMVSFIEKTPLFNLCIALPEEKRPEVWHCSSILSVLAKDGNTAALKRLLVHPSAQVNMDDSNYSTPLAHMIMQGNTEMFQLLLARDDIELNTGVGPRDSPLFMSLYLNHLDYARDIVRVAKERDLGYLRMPGTPKGREKFRKQFLADLCNQKWLTDPSAAKAILDDFYPPEEFFVNI